jgi:outer membrane protein OmpA-like peptidoglycan-associated protein
MAVVRHTLIVVLLSCAVIAAQPSVVPSPIPASRLLQTSHIEGPLEVRPATADEEAILAGTSYVKYAYEAPSTITVVTFVTTYRDALFAAGWKLIAVPKVDNVPPPEGIANIAAHYMNNARNIYTRLSRSPEGGYEINVADVGEEDWSSALAKQCHVPIYSVHFDLDRPALRTFESEPTLQKLANMLKAKSAPAVEIQGHMDNVGEAGVAARQTLSEARAKAVVAWLTAHGVPAAKVTAKGYGKSKPVADNDTDLGRELNRRIEVACLRR